MLRAAKDDIVDLSARLAAVESERDALKAELTATHDKRFASLQAQLQESRLTLQRERQLSDELQTRMLSTGVAGYGSYAWRLSGVRCLTKPRYYSPAFRAGPYQW